MAYHNRCRLTMGNRPVEKKWKRLETDGFWFICDWAPAAARTVASRDGKFSAEEI
jgi:hypothetical protein